MKPSNQERVGQRYEKGDRVQKRTAGGNKPPRVGTIKLATEKNDSRGHPSWYYSVLWDGLKSTSIHAQQALIPLND